MSTSKYDKGYMQIARVISSWSNDPDTQVGCVIVKDNYILSQGYNGTPKGTDNEMKCANGNTLDTVIHAEMNALLHAKESLKEATCYTTFYPCKRCAIHLYQAGITEIVYADSANTANQDAAGRWIADTHNIKIRRVLDDSDKEDTKLSQ